MSQTIGYTRISKPKQSIARQIRNIRRAYPDAYIVQEAYTESTINRKEWNILFHFIIYRAFKIRQNIRKLFSSVFILSNYAKMGHAK